MWFLEWLFGTDPIQAERERIALELAFRACPRWIL